MFKRLTLALAGLLLCATVGASQEACSNLSMTAERRADSFFDVWTEISLAPPISPTWLVVGLGEGKTELQLPGTTLILGLQDIVATPLLGRTDANGDVSRRFIVPHTIALTLHTQALSVEFVRTDRGRDVTFCLSNPATVDLR